MRGFWPSSCPRPSAWGYQTHLDRHSVLGALPALQPPAGLLCTGCIRLSWMIVSGSNKWPVLIKEGYLATESGGTVWTRCKCEGEFTVAGEMLVGGIMKKCRKAFFKDSKKWICHEAVAGSRELENSQKRTSDNEIRWCFQGRKEDFWWILKGCTWEVRTKRFCNRQPSK